MSLAVSEAENASGPSAAIAEDVIDVTFGVDNHFVPHMASALMSVIRTAPGARFRFIIMHDGVEPARREAVEAMAAPNQFVWVELKDGDLPDYFKVDHYTRAILFRLGLEDFAPADCRRVIYLDSDLTVLRDIREFWRFDLQGAPIGAIDDTYTMPDDFAARWGVAFDKHRYFNSGVLLIDLEQVRRDKLFTKALGVIAEHGKTLKFADQCALNLVVWGNWKPLPRDWNAQRCNVIRSLADLEPADRRFYDVLPGIVHYVGPEKPWLNHGYHPWSWKYWDNLARTPFLAEVAKKNGVDFFQRARLWLRWQLRRPRGARVLASS